MSSYVINSRGEKEPFSFRKVYRSAKRAGAPAGLAQEIAQIIEQEMRPGIETSVIFERVKRLLKEKNPRAALKFNLKQAMRKLGPTGFVFEKYIGELLSKQGFRIKLNQSISGASRCSYEIDFLAEDRKTTIIGECKYHNQGGRRVDLSVALQNYARFLDIKNSRFSSRHNKLKAMLVTNTKFTSEVIKYANCVGTKLLGWRYPRSRGLEYFIDIQKLYPITILPSLRKPLMNIFAEKKIVLAEDMLRIDVERFARENQVPESQLNALVKEAKILLS